MFKIILIDGGISAVDGFFCSAEKAGFEKDEYDVGYIYSDTICDISYTFTTNKFQAAPLKHTLKNSIKQTNFLLLNSKNANALTGEEGIKDVEELLNFCNENFYCCFVIFVFLNDKSKSRYKAL